MNETPQLVGRTRANRERIVEAIRGTQLALVDDSRNLVMTSKATLSCERGHVFSRNVASILKWKSGLCPDCQKEASRIRAAEAKLPNPNHFDWIPKEIELGRGTKPRDLRGTKFGSLTAIRVVGKHSSGSLLWECQCSCGGSTTKKSASLTAGKAKSCGCIRGTTKKYKTRAPNTGLRYTIKSNQDHFSSKKAWSIAVKKKKGDQCEVCGWSFSSCDVHHIIERQNGGKNSIENSLVLCPNHHRTAHSQGVSILLKLRDARLAFQEVESQSGKHITAVIACCRYALLLLDYENDNTLFKIVWISLIRSLKILTASLNKTIRARPDVKILIKQVYEWNRMLSSEFLVPYSNGNVNLVIGNNCEAVPKDLFRMVVTLDGRTIDCRDCIEKLLDEFEALVLQNRVEAPDHHA